MAMTRSLPTADSAGLSIVDERLIQSGEIVGDASGNARTGVLPAHTGALVTALPSRAVSVAPFVGVFSRTGAGVEKAANNAATTVAIDPAPNSNSRIDVIWARCQFTASTDANNLAVLGVTTGDAAQDPVKKAIPAGAIELGTVLFPAGATTTQSNGVIVNPTHQFTAMEGGCVLLRSQAEQDAWVPHEGSEVYRLDTQRGYKYLGSSIGWAHISGKPEIGAFTPTGIYAGGGSPFRVLGSGGRVTPEGNIVSSSATFTAGDNYTFGNIPAAFAPKTAQIVLGIVNVDGIAEITFAPTGVVTGKLNKSFTGTLNLWVNAGGWADKRLV